MFALTRAREGPGPCMMDVESGTARSIADTWITFQLL
jgi:hypothetical protein